MFCFFFFQYTRPSRKAFSFFLYFTLPYTNTHTLIIFSTFYCYLHKFLSCYSFFKSILISSKSHICWIFLCHFTHFHSLHASLFLIHSLSLFMCLTMFVLHFQLSSRRNQFSLFLKALVLQPSKFIFSLPIPFAILKTVALTELY